MLVLGDDESIMLDGGEEDVGALPSSVVVLLAAAESAVEGLELSVEVDELLEPELVLLEELESVEEGELVMDVL